MTKLSLNSTRHRVGIFLPDGIETQVKLDKIKNGGTTNTLKYGMMGEDVSRGMCLYKNIRENKLLSVSCMTVDADCLGVALQEYRRLDKACIVSSGKFQSDTLYFKAPFGRPVWISRFGFPTDVLPTHGQAIVIGFTLTKDSFFVTIGADSGPVAASHVQTHKKPTWRIPMATGSNILIAAAHRNTQNNTRELLSIDDVTYDDVNIILHLKTPVRGTLNYIIL